MFATLDGFLDEMGALALESAVHLGRAESPEPGEIARLRGEFSRVMIAYQRFVHRNLFELPVRSGTPAEIDRARAIKTECILISEEYRIVLGLWPLPDVAARWPDYRAAAQAFCDRTRTHIEQVRGMVARPPCVDAGSAAVTDMIFSA